ncbi:MAG: Holliday junction branch migration protein RuvA [Endomicrobium sp.]|jgi:Holliday junction DNA helicase RuvA|nr:Holliday junction branch migration protein RuvA [Endomicrobium sp.]
MIDYISGTLDSKTPDSIVVDVNGIGYKISVAVSSFEKLPEAGSGVKIYIVEAVSGMYGGVISLYGFLSNEERDMYMLIKEEVPATGAKKAMEYLDKISKSFADFKTAVVSKNAAMLHDIFGFTKKTADKLISALKEKIISINVSGGEKWAGASSYCADTIVTEAISALMALGYKELQAKNAVNKSYEEGSDIKIEDLIKKSLKHL